MQGQRDQSMTMIDERTDTRGNPYYWLGLSRGMGTTQEGTDLHAVYHDRISVTPLHMNLTHARARNNLASAFQAYPKA